MVLKPVLELGFGSTTDSQQATSSLLLWLPVHRPHLVGMQSSSKHPSAVGIPLSRAQILPHVAAPRHHILSAKPDGHDADENFGSLHPKRLLEYMHNDLSSMNKVATAPWSPSPNQFQISRMGFEGHAQGHSIRTGSQWQPAVGAGAWSCCRHLVHRQSVTVRTASTCSRLLALPQRSRISRAAPGGGLQCWRDHFPSWLCIRASAR